MYSRARTSVKLAFLLDQFAAQNRVADILITAKRNDSFNGHKFRDQYNLFNRRVLSRLFKRGVSVITRSTRGVLHSHTAVELVAANDFDWHSFDQSEHYYELYMRSHDRADLHLYAHFLRKYRRSLPSEWQKANRRLMQAGRKYGLGRVFMTPVRKNMNAYKWYLVGNLPKHREHRDEGIHYLRSWGLQNISTSGFQPVNKHTQDYRRRLARFCTGLHLTSENYNMYLRNALGARWYYQISDLVRDIDHLNSSQQNDYRSILTVLDTYRLRTE